MRHVCRVQLVIIIIILIIIDGQRRCVLQEEEVDDEDISDTENTTVPACEMQLQLQF